VLARLSGEPAEMVYGGADLVGVGADDEVGGRALEEAQVPREVELGAHLGLDEGVGEVHLARDVRAADEGDVREVDVVEYDCFGLHARDLDDGGAEVVQAGVPAQHLGHAHGARVGDAHASMCVYIYIYIYIYNLILIAFITGNSSLEPLIEGLCAQIHVNLR